ncbi:MAG: hypothetical protein Q4A01_04730 [Coriobacteriales bacterium]|nr:hypothetical protein [Coriobacteriales bacterium]
MALALVAVLACVIVGLQDGPGVGDTVPDTSDLPTTPEATDADDSDSVASQLDVLHAPQGSRRFQTQCGVDKTATELVGAYRSARVCLLHEAEYLDMLGNAWGCVVEGPGWVDVCLVRAGQDDGKSTVSVERLDAGGEESVHGTDGEGDGGTGDG